MSSPRRHWSNVNWINVSSLQRSFLIPYMFNWILLYNTLEVEISAAPTTLGVITLEVVWSYKGQRGKARMTRDDLIRTDGGRIACGTSRIVLSDTLCDCVDIMEWGWGEYRYSDWGVFWIPATWIVCNWYKPVVPQTKINCWHGTVNMGTFYRCSHGCTHTRRWSWRACIGSNKSWFDDVRRDTDTEEEQWKTRERKTVSFGVVVWLSSQGKVSQCVWNNVRVATVHLK